MTEGPNNEGWVKLHRKLLEHPRFKDGAWLTMWNYLLLKANHKPGRTTIGGKVIDLKPGQLVTGIFKLIDATGLSESKVKRVLLALENDKQIVKQGTSTCTIITILNWESHQQIVQRNVEQTSSEHPTNDERPSTNKNDKNVQNEYTHQASPIFKLPTLGEVLQFASTKPWKKEDVENFFHYYDAMGWIDTNNRPIFNWQSKINYWMGNQRQMDYQRRNQVGSQEPKQKQENIKIRDVPL